MKKIVLFLCFLGYFLLSYPQSSYRFDPILDECLSYCIDSLPTAYKADYILADNYPYNYKIKIPKDKNIQFVTLYPSSILSLSMRREMQKIFRKKGIYEGARVMLYDGIDLMQDTVVVRFSFRYIHRIKKVTYVAISSGVFFYYCYSQIEEKWVCVRKEDWGI
jgi:hypothetical protein